MDLTTRLKNTASAVSDNIGPIFFTVLTLVLTLLFLYFF